MRLLLDTYAFTHEKLPPYHKDPFDRIIIAQAIVEDLVIVSIDGAFSDYAVPVIW